MREMLVEWKELIAGILLSLVVSTGAFAQHTHKTNQRYNRSSEEVVEALAVYAEQLPKMNPITGLEPIDPKDFTITIYKPKMCGCCSAWIKHVKKAGFNVDVKSVIDLNGVEPRQVVPEYFHACHTSEVNGYIIEGHVPPEDIIRLLTEQVEATGIAVPDMPWGSPGMAKRGHKVDYDVFLFHEDGRQALYSSYEEE